MLRNEPDNRCRVCYDKEKSGNNSYRLETLEKYADSFDLKNISGDGTMDGAPFYFDIRFSNNCNFRCRTCWHGASSKWFNEARKLKRQAGDKALLKNIDNLDLFLLEIKPWISGLREIYFAGGEPLVMEEHYRLLEYLIDNGKTDVLLRYNTNFSLLKYKQNDLTKLWQHFPKVTIMASLDAKGKLGEYIRKDMHWNEIAANRALLNKELPHVKFMVTPTVSVLNVYHLPDFYKFLISEKWIAADDFRINILHRPFFYNVQALPKELKLKVLDRYKEAVINLPENVQAELNKVIDFMQDQDLSKHWSAFLREVKKMDQMRNEKIEEVCHWIL